MAAISRPTLTPGRYLVQDFSIDRAFMTTDQTFIKKRQDPIIALPSGAMASVVSILRHPYPPHTSTHPLTHSLTLTVANRAEQPPKQDCRGEQIGRAHV